MYTAPALTKSIQAGPFCGTTIETIGFYRQKVQCWRVCETVFSNKLLNRDTCKKRNKNLNQKGKSYLRKFAVSKISQTI